MQLLIRSGSEAAEGGGVEEWAMLELQGTLEAVDGVDGKLSGERIGHLAYSKEGTPYMILGHHLIQGSEVELAKPLAVLVKAPSGGESEHPSHRIQALIKRKLVFKTRPKPIVSNLPKRV